MAPTASVRDYIKLHFIVVLWGVTAILGMEISMPSTDVVLYRTGIAALALLILMKIRKRSIKLEKRDLIKILATGIIVATHWVLFFEAARISTISVCLAGMATVTFWTSLLEPLLGKRRVKGFEVALGLVAIVGIAIIFQFEFDNALGLMLAIAAAFLSAFFYVLNSQYTKKHSPYVITFYEMIGACITLHIFIPIYQSAILDTPVGYASPTTRDIGFLLLLSLACTVYAFAESVELMRRISAFMVNLSINLEPIYGIIMAVLIYGDKEKMSGGFYWGTLIILASVLSYPWLNKKFRRSP
jgi:drug/metabolite transporter (DMT)-like permease